MEREDNDEYNEPSFVKIRLVEPESRPFKSTNNNNVDMVEDHNIDNDNATHQRIGGATDVNNNSTFQRDRDSTMIAVIKQKNSYDY